MPRTVSLYSDKLHGLPSHVSNAQFRKKRLVFKSQKPTAEQLKDFKEGLVDFTFTCGDRVDDTQLWMTNEKLGCDDEIETLYYSTMVDNTQDSENILICYGCGKKLESDALQKYIGDKTMHKTVKPACTNAKCAVVKKLKWKCGGKRKVDKEWSARNLMRRKLVALQRLEESERRANERNQQ